MKKTAVFMIGLILAGILAYFSGYYVYTTRNPKPEMKGSINLQRTVTLSEDKGLAETEEYYIAKIEKEQLMIYKMPEEIVYESVEIRSLHFSEKEKPQLLEGMVFQTLPEVFEFLENSMS